MRLAAQLEHVAQRDELKIEGEPGILARVDRAGDRRQLHDLGRLELVEGAAQVREQAGVGVAQLHAGGAHEPETVEQEALIGVRAQRIVVVVEDVLDQAVHHEIVDDHGLDAEAPELEREIMADEAGAADQHDALPGELVLHRVVFDIGHGCYACCWNDV